MTLIKMNFNKLGNIKVKIGQNLLTIKPYIMVPVN